MKPQEIGQRAEQFAREYLAQQGLQFKQQNYHSRYGEIDLIMQQDEYLCFIEVRARKYHGYGQAIDTVDWRKQQKIIQTAQDYLQKYPENEQFVGRFDVIAIDYADTKVWTVLNFEQQLQQLSLQWIKDAYTV